MKFTHLFAHPQPSHRRRRWYPTPVHLSGKSHGRRSLVGCSTWGRKESDRTEHTFFLSKEMYPADDARISSWAGPKWNSLIYLPTPSLLTEKAMAPHSSTLAWQIPWMEEPGRLQSKESLRVGHDWVTSLSLFTFMCWRRKWQPTPVFLSGESQGWGSLVGCRLWGRTESDTTKAT